MKHANGELLTSVQLREARQARAQGKRLGLSRRHISNPYNYTTETHKHQAWAEGYTRGLSAAQLRRTEAEYDRANGED